MFTTVGHLRQTLQSVIQERRSADLDMLKQYVDRPNIYVTFRRMLTVTINPQYMWGTPNGVYAYPMTSQVWSWINDNKIPYAYDQPYCVLLQDIHPETTLIINKVNANEALNVLKSVGGPEMSFEDFKRYTQNAHQHSAGARLWLALVAHAMGREKQDVLEPDDVFDEPDSADSTQRLSSNISRMLRRAGYTAVLDTGSAIISQPDPIQIVFLTSQAFDVIGAVDNPMKLNVNGNTEHDARTLARRLQGRSTSFKINTIQNASRFPAALKVLADDPDEQVRAEVAARSNDVNLLMKLTKDKMGVVRLAALRKLSRVNDKVAADIAKDIVFNDELENVQFYALAALDRKTLKHISMNHPSEMIRDAATRQLQNW